MEVDNNCLQTVDPQPCYVSYFRSKVLLNRRTAADLVRMRGTAASNLDTGLLLKSFIFMSPLQEHQEKTWGSRVYTRSNTKVDVNRHSSVFLLLSVAPKRTSEISHDDCHTGAQSK